MKKYQFKDIVVGEEGLMKGPFGSDLKRSLYVSRGLNTYKVYLQENILKENNKAGEHYISKEYFDSKMSRYEVKEGDFITIDAPVSKNEGQPIGVTFFIPI